MECVRTFSQGKSLTWADLESFDDDGYRYELLDGTLLAGLRHTAPPSATPG